MKVYPYLPGFVMKTPSGIKTAYENFLRILKIARIKIAKSPYEDGIDIFHAHTYTPEVMLMKQYFRSRGVKTVVTAHSSKTDIKHSFWFFDVFGKQVWGLMKSTYKQADAVIVPSRYAANLLRQDGIRSVPISNGIDLKHWKRINPNPFLKQSGAEEPIVLGVGLVSIRKGCDVFSYVARKNPDANFVWAGTYIKEFIAEKDREKIMNIPENMKYIGIVDDIRTAYSAATMFLAPTRSENQGLTMLEAGSIGVPIVVRDMPVFSEFEDGKDLLKAKTRKEFAEKTRILLDDKNLRKKLSRNMRKRVEKHDLPAVAKRFRKFYETLLEGGEWWEI